MATNKYALAVQIDDDLFEIFEILYLEKDTELDLKYKKAANHGANFISIPIQNTVKLSTFLDQNNLLYNLTNYSYDISEDQSIYLGISKNKVFIVMLIENTNITDQKYQAAFENNVVLVDVSLENNIGLGDLWDKQKIIKVL